MFRFFIASIVLFFSVLPLAFPSQNFARTHVRPIVIEPGRPALDVGEQFFYTVSWLGIPVGHASLTIEEETEFEGRPVHHIVARARSNKFLSVFYPLEDTVHSYVDREKGFSWHYLKYQREGRYRAEEEMRFDHVRGQARYHSFLNGSTKWISIPAGIHDPLSAFYAFRKMSVEAGQTYRMKVNSDEKNWTMELRVGQTKTLELTRIGTFDCFEVEPIARFKGLLVDRGRLWVWFTADSSRIPVLIKIDTPWGAVTGRIRKAGRIKQLKLCPFQKDLPE